MKMAAVPPAIDGAVAQWGVADHSEDDIIGNASDQSQSAAFVWPNTRKPRHDHRESTPRIYTIDNSN